MRPQERRYHPASGQVLFRSTTFPPTKANPIAVLFQGNLSEGAVLFAEFSHSYHRHLRQANSTAACRVDGRQTFPYPVTEELPVISPELARYAVVSVNA